MIRRRHQPSQACDGGILAREAGELCLQEAQIHIEVIQLRASITRTERISADYVPARITVSPRRCVLFHHIKPAPGGLVRQLMRLNRGTVAGNPVIDDLPLVGIEYTEHFSMITMH